MTVISHSVLKQELLDRVKTQTIRPIYSDHWLKLEPGDRLQHFWKLRKPRKEKQHHFLGESVVEDVFRVGFGRAGHIVEINRVVEEKMVPFSGEERCVLAERDGFGGRGELIQWFVERYGEDLFGQEFAVIRWDWVEGIPPGSPKCPSCGERYWVTEVTGGEPWWCGVCGHEAGYESPDPEVREKLPKLIDAAKSQGGV